VPAVTPPRTASGGAQSPGTESPGTESPGTESLGYEQAREELAEVVRRLEAGGLSLEESLALWERGEKLADVCAQWLEGARKRLDTALAEKD
jgi:exodeoxyribonuclease VII small subunit